MRFDRRLLGSGIASALVALAVQKLRISRRVNLGKWQHGGEASRRVEKENLLEHTNNTSESSANSSCLERLSSAVSRDASNLSDC